MTTIDDLEKEEAARILGRRKIPAFQPGDTVRVNVRIKEGEAWGGDKMGSFDWYVAGVIGKAK